MSTGIEPTITLTDEGEWWAARHTETGVASQGRSKEEALDNLDEALAAYRGAGEPVTDEELRDLGIEPENNTSGSIEESDIFE